VTFAAHIIVAIDMVWHERLVLTSHDIGMQIVYAIADNFPDRVERVAMIDATIPGISSPPPLLGLWQVSDFLWHLNFNRYHDINEQSVADREDTYFAISPPPVRVP
jgi:pimeloyl-ACP methyl ester carboxylesterase